MTQENKTIEELIQIIRASDEIFDVIELLNKTIEKVADIRIKISENDNIELRQSTIKVIKETLKEPLTVETKTKKQLKNIEYN